MIKQEHNKIEIGKYVSKMYSKQCEILLPTPRCEKKRIDSLCRSVFYC